MIDTTSSITPTSNPWHQGSKTSKALMHQAQKGWSWIRTHPLSSITVGALTLGGSLYATNTFQARDLAHQAFQSLSNAFQSHSKSSRSFFNLSYIINQLSLDNTLWLGGKIGKGASYLLYTLKALYRMDQAVCKASSLIPPPTALLIFGGFLYYHRNKLNEERVQVRNPIKDFFNLPSELKRFWKDLKTPSTQPSR